MQIYTPITIAFAAALGVVLLHPKLMHSPLWRASITPLASIIGSGFLVAGPILAHATGNWAWLAMLALCAVAYVYGFAIRRNIQLLEPMLNNGAAPSIVILERASHVILAFAYFISVAYYLNLFASFLLRGAGIIDDQIVSVLSTATIAAITGYGIYRGLRGLETIEEWAVGIKLSLFAGLLAAMAAAGIFALFGDGLHIANLNHPTGTKELQILLGLVILVQGFETSRFLGSQYDAETRARTMRYAQWISTAIYITFIILATPYFTGKLPQNGGETAIIDMLAPIGAVVAPVIIIAAVCSQLSAAVADMNGAGGLLHDTSAKRIPLHIGYAMTGVFAIFVTWAANIFEIITYASKAFVIFYGVQSLLAAIIAARSNDNRDMRLVALFSLATIFAIIVVLFGIPAES